MCTGEGSLEPLAQAEPVEQATPAWSRAMKSACRSRPTKAMFDVVGRRSASSPMISIWQSSAFAATDSNSLRSDSQCERATRVGSCPRVRARLACRRRARRIRCRGGCPLVGSRREDLGESSTSLAHDERADAERATEFVGSDRHRGSAKFAETQRELAGGLGGVGVERDVVVDCKSRRVRRWVG